MKIERPLVVRIESTLNCNHRCDYCYNPREKQSLGTIEEQTRRISEIVKTIIDWGVFDITFTGGEPFVNKPTLYSGIDEASKSGVDYSINTNATLINDDDAQKLKDTGVTSLFVSFPSHREDIFDANVGIKGAYQAALKGLDALAKKDLKVTINTVVTRKPINNIDGVFDTAKFLIERYRNIVRFATASVSPNFIDQAEQIIANSDIAKIFDQMLEVHNRYGIEIRNSRPLPICFSEGLDPVYRKHDLFRGCTIGMANSLTVSPTGDLKLCPVLSRPVANVLTDNFEDIKKIVSKYDGSTASELKEFSPEECSDCVILETCKGGCKSEALAMGKDQRKKSRYQKSPQQNQDLLLGIMENIDLIEPHLLSIRKKIKWREDGNNFAVRGEKFALLTKAEFEMLKYLKSLDTFSPSELCARLNLNTGLFNVFLNKLAKAKIILI